MPEKSSTIFKGSVAYRCLHSKQPELVVTNSRDVCFRADRHCIFISPVSLSFLNPGDTVRAFNTPNTAGRGGPLRSAVFLRQYGFRASSPGALKQACIRFSGSKGDVSIPYYQMYAYVNEEHLRVSQYREIRNDRNAAYPVFLSVYLVQLGAGGKRDLIALILEYLIEFEETLKRKAEYILAPTSSNSASSSAAAADSDEYNPRPLKRSAHATSIARLMQDSL